MNESDLLERARKYKKFAIVGTAVLGLVLVPIIFMMIKGLIGLGIAGVLAITLVNAAPVIADKAANWKLAMLKSEAAKHPIETLQNEYQRRQIALKDFVSKVTKFDAEVRSFADKVDGFKEKYPKDVEKFDDQLTQLKAVLKNRREKIKQAEGSLRLFSHQIEKASAIWQMCLAAQKMNEAAGNVQEDYLGKIKAETSLDTVSVGLNEAFAELETSFELDEVEKKALDYSPVEPLRVAKVVDAEVVKAK